MKGFILTAISLVWTFEFRPFFRFLKNVVFGAFSSQRSPVESQSGNMDDEGFRTVELNEETVL